MESGERKASCRGHQCRNPEKMICLVGNCVSTRRQREPAGGKGENRTGTGLHEPGDIQVTQLFLADKESPTVYGQKGNKIDRLRFSKMLIRSLIANKKKCWAADTTDQHRIFL